MKKRKYIKLRISITIPVIISLLTLILTSGSRALFQVNNIKQQQKLENSPTAAYTELMPGTEEIYSYAKDLTDMGARLPGTFAWEEANAYVTEKLTSFGLENVKTVDSKTTLWTCTESSLTVGGEEISVYGMKHTFNTGIGSNTTGENGIDAEIVYVGDGSEWDFKRIDVEGKIVVADVDFSPIPVKLAGLISYLSYDPYNQLGTITNPYSANTYPYNYYYAMENGAVGFIGVLTDYFESNEYNNEDYSYMGGKMQIPGMWITNSAAATIKELIAEGKDDANLKMSVTVESTNAGAVVGVIPGKSDETIIIQSHYDSATPGGAEDASGTAVVLALAKFYSQIPADELDRTLMFVLMDTHFNDYESHDYFIAEYLGDGHKIVADICVEHIANEGEIDENGNLVMTGEAETKLFFVNDINALTTITTEEIVRHNLAKTVVLPTYIFDEVPSDADMIYQEDVPIISMISAPIYLYDNCDTVDKICKEELLPVAETFADIIWRVDDTPTEKLK